MKITIEGSYSELAELIKRLGCMETEAKKEELPPLLTELVKSNSIVKNAKVRPIERTFSSLKPNFQAALEKFCGDDKVNELAKTIENADKENAPQTEFAERNTNQDIIEKQMELLSEASKFCLGDIRLTQYLPELTRAMIELNPFCRQPARGR